MSVDGRGVATVMPAPARPAILPMFGGYSGSRA